MPYRRRYARRRRAPPRRRQTATRRIARQEAKKVVRRSIESKIHDGLVFEKPVPFDGASAFWSLTTDPSAGTSMTQGPSETQYLGSHIMPTYLIIRGNINPAATLPDPYNSVRVIVYQAKTDLIVTAGLILANVTGIYSIHSPFLTSIDDKFRVIKDKLYKIDTLGPQSTNFKMKIGMRKLRQITFTNTTGTIESGALVIACVSDSGAPSHPEITLFWRLHYKDA